MFPFILKQAKHFEGFIFILMVFKYFIIVKTSPLKALQFVQFFDQETVSFMTRLYSLGCFTKICGVRLQLFYVKVYLLFYITAWLKIHERSVNKKKNRLTLLR